MSLATLAEATAGRLLGRLMRYAVAGLLMVVFALAALYHFTIAGMLALELQFGVLNARLIVAGVYLVLMLASAGMMWFMARKTAKPDPATPPTPRHMQIAALIEALLLGYELSRKGHKAR